jgi:hypothetical protein
VKISLKINPPYNETENSEKAPYSTDYLQAANKDHDCQPSASLLTPLLTLNIIL